MLPLLLMLCLSADGEKAPSMRSNLTALFVLQPHLASPAKFRDPSNAEEIAASLDQLAVLQHPAMAPTQAILSTQFTERVKQARADFSAGRADSARLRLRGLSSLCLGCHSRAPAGVTPLHLSTAHLKLLPAERAHLLAATRQYDAAILLWRQLLAQPARNELEGYDQLLALRAALGIAVRVKDDPGLAVELLAAMKDKGGAPLARRTAAQWLDQAQAWKAERFSATAQPPAALFARAKALVEATPAFTSAANDEEHLVVLQRATSYLNRAIELEPGAPWRGEALYLLAVASAAALDPELWQLDELYLEACVREYPHSKLAVRCVDRLADRLVYLSTLGGVTQVPLDEASRLGDLRALAR